MSDDLLSRLARERADADRAYNEALSALDAALVKEEASEPASVALPAGPGEVPAGWRGPVLRAMRDWLAPWIAAQQTFNAQAASAIRTIEARDQAREAAVERFQHALIVFLQQITAFVETKERQLEADAAARFGPIPDLQAQVAVLQRATQMLTRKLGSAAQAPAADVVGSPTVVTMPDQDDYKYVAFEDQFRGSVDEIRAKVAAYVPLFAGATNVLDIGCGRGEFLTALHHAGISARGIDLNGEMIAAARERGLDVEIADALAYVTAAPDESIGGIFAAQVVEHLHPAYLIRLLDAAFHKLRPGAPILLETINPTCWVAFFSSYLRDPTHVRPVHPDTLEYLVRASGFANVSIRYGAPVPEAVRMRSIELPADLLRSGDATVRAVVETAHAVNANAAILNSLAFSNQDYAVVGYRS